MVWCRSMWLKELESTSHYLLLTRRTIFFFQRNTEACLSFGILFHQPKEGRTQIQTLLLRKCKFFIVFLKLEWPNFWKVGGCHQVLPYYVGGPVSPHHVGSPSNRSPFLLPDRQPSTSPAACSLPSHCPIPPPGMGQAVKAGRQRKGESGCRSIRSREKVGKWQPSRKVLP